MTVDDHDESPGRARGPVRTVGAAVLVPLFLAGSTARALDPTRAIDQYTRRTWSLEQGLPQSTVNDIAQDRDGYLWVATFGGLVRFDGVRAVVVSSAQDTGIPSDRVTALAIDDEGALWIGTEGSGLAVRRGERFERVPLGESRGPSVTRLVRATGGGVWAATNRGLFRVRGTSVVRRYREADGLPTDVVMSVAAGPGGEIWVGTHRGLCILRGDRCELPQMPSLRTASILAISSGSQGTFVGTNDALHEMSAGSRAIPVRPGVPVRALLQDSAGSVWVGIDPGGLFRIRPRSESLDNASGLASGSVKSLFEDREGNLWVGTTGGGLFKLSDGRAFGIGILSRGSTLSTLPIVADGKGGVYIGTRCEGVARANAEGLVFLAEKGKEPFRDCIWSLHRDEDETLWIGTFGRGLARRTPDGRFERFAGPATPGRVVRALARRGDRVLVGGDDGVFALDPATGASERVPGTEGLEIYLIDATEDGELWLGTNRGLHAIAPASHRVWSKANGLASDVVRALRRDPSGVLWVGTYGGGLHRVDGRRVTVFDAKNGLFEDAVSSIVEDESGRFWLTGNKGVTRVQRRRLEEFARAGSGPLDAELLDASSGMRTSECNGGGQPAAHLGGDGRLWVPTVDGVAVFDTRREARNTVPPPVRIEEVLVEGRSVGSTESLVLPAGASNLEIRYTALSFKRPEKVLFRTRLSGLDEKWVDAGTRRVAYYPYLPPGSFRFEVLAANDDGVWSPTGAALPFARRARFVETRWFPAALVLAVGALATAALLGARRVSRLRQLRLEFLVKERTEELSRLNHDLLGTKARLEQANVVLERLAAVDPLTGLLNRRAFDEALAKEGRRAIRARVPLAVLMIDVDHFKAFNDHYGHNAGDECLRRIAAAIASRVQRTGDLVARWGGEEFAAVLYDCGADAAHQIAERIRCAVGEERIRHASSPSGFVTVSVGGATRIPETDESALVLHRAADMALYEAKLSGRDRVSIAA